MPTRLTTAERRRPCSQMLPSLQALPGVTLGRRRAEAAAARLGRQLGHRHPAASRMSDGDHRVPHGHPRLLRRRWAFRFVRGRSFDAVGSRRQRAGRRHQRGAGGEVLRRRGSDRPGAAHVRRPRRADHRRRRQCRRSGPDRRAPSRRATCSTTSCPRPSGTRSPSCSGRTSTDNVAALLDGARSTIRQAGIAARRAEDDDAADGVRPGDGAGRTDGHPAVAARRAGARARRSRRLRRDLALRVASRPRLRDLHRARTAAGARRAAGRRPRRRARRVGSAIGVVAALAATKMLSTLLYGVAAQPTRSRWPPQSSSCCSSACSPPSCPRAARA